MADNVTLPGTGVAIATDDVGGKHYQRFKLDIGGDGAASPVAADNPLPVEGTVALDATALAALAAAAPPDTQPISVVDLPLPTGAATQATLASVLAKLSADPSTNTTLAAVGAVLVDILAKLSADPATQTTLAAVLTKLDASIAITATALPLPTGASTETTLAALLAKVIGAPATEAKQNSLIALLPTALGSAADAASFSVAQSTESKAQVGALTETAPASDTASSGLNGRLQRIAQRLTALIALLPASLGIKTAAASLSMAPASDAVFAVTGSALVRTVLLSAVTATGAGSASADSGRPPSFSADLSGTGTIAATVLVQGRNVSSGQWTTLGTITLSGSTTVNDGFASLTRYMEYRANCTVISGTSATLTVAMGS